MKAQTIITIKELLYQNLERADEHYTRLKIQFGEKYKTEWFSGMLSDSERTEYEQAKINLFNLREAYDDFCKHQW